MSRKNEGKSFGRILWISFLIIMGLGLAFGLWWVSGEINLTKGPQDYKQEYEQAQEANEQLQEELEKERARAEALEADQQGFPTWLYWSVIVAVVVLSAFYYFVAEDLETGSIDQEAGEKIARQYLEKKKGWKDVKQAPTLLTKRKVYTDVDYQSWQFISEDSGRWYAYRFFRNHTGLGRVPDHLCITVVLKSNEPRRTLQHIEGGFQQAWDFLRSKAHKQPLLNTYQEELSAARTAAEHSEIMERLGGER